MNLHGRRSIFDIMKGGRLHNFICGSTRCQRVLSAKRIRLSQAGLGSESGSWSSQKRLVRALVAAHITGLWTNVHV